MCVRVLCVCGNCVFVARSQKNNMEFSRQLGKQQSLCVRHTLVGM